MPYSNVPYHTHTPCTGDRVSGQCLFVWSVALVGEVVWQRVSCIALLDRAWYSGLSILRLSSKGDWRGGEVSGGCI